MNNTYRLSLTLFLCLLLNIGVSSANGQDTDPTNKIKKIVGQDITLTHPIVDIKFGKNYTGKLYTFNFGSSKGFSSWFFYENGYIRIVNEAKEQDDVMDHVVKSVFNIRYNGAYCIVYLTDSYPSYLGVTESSYEHHGDVYCPFRNGAARNKVLSEKLDNITNASQARAALEPYLSR